MGADPGIEARKASLRASILERREALSADERATAAQKVAGRLAAWLGGRRGATIAGYCAIRSELDPAPALEWFAHCGFNLALPAISGEDVVFRRYRPGDPLHKGPLGTRAPGAEAGLVRPDIVLVPFAAFDRNGHRLGWGKGYYDRLLARLSLDGKVLAVGVGYAMQEVEAVPTARHDQPLDAIATDLELILCR